MSLAKDLKGSALEQKQQALILSRKDLLYDLLVRNDYHLPKMKSDLCTA